MDVYHRTESEDDLIPVYFILGTHHSMLLCDMFLVFVVSGPDLSGCNGTSTLADGIIERYIN